MKVQDFQKKYHDYMADTCEEARAEIERLEPVCDDRGVLIKIIPVYFDGINRWGLMVETAYNFCTELGIL